MVCRSTDSDIYYAQTSGKDYLVMDLGFISVVDKWTDWSYPYSDIYLVDCENVGINIKVPVLNPKNALIIYFSST